ncbi:MAG: dihydrofolate reductase family protein [Burkholderiales bacterium]
MFIATSLDGFVSRSDGSIDWLHAANAVVPQGEDCGYAAFMSTIDGLVMGRNTFEQAMSFEEWPYGSTPVVVLSHTLRSLPRPTPSTVSLVADLPAVLVKRLAEQGHRHLYIDGGLTIQSFLAAGLIAEMTITVIPILLGAGKPLFGSLHGDVHLELLSSEAYPFGFVQNKYRLIPTAAPAASITDIAARTTGVPGSHEGGPYR